ncbi:hypothetical protein LR48_Vigan09g113000 [Vigna angularis]|uniref:Uncharacterized protein n=1 Tax=Phaseolus angularis TaxID=3914 RepID=A0A0L9VBP2_PHAAN|nr:hypothetical protein LR48_Vigan09g113000 [Vigna angularis]
MAGSGEISQIYISEGPASARKDPSSIPNVSEAIASLSSTPKANSPREKRRCSFAPRLRRGQSSEPPLLTLEEVTPCFLLIGDLGLMTAVLCGAKEREREIGGFVVVRCKGEREIGGNIAGYAKERESSRGGSVVVWLHLENVIGEEDFTGWSVLVY